MIAELVLGAFVVGIVARHIGQGRQVREEQRREERLDARREARRKRRGARDSQVRVNSGSRSEVPDKRLGKLGDGTKHGY